MVVNRVEERESYLGKKKALKESRFANAYDSIVDDSFDDDYDDYEMICE
jgi:hypothetical protein